MTILLTITEAKMIDEKRIPNTQEQGVPAQQASEEQDLVPPQYRGLPSEVVEEIWQNPVYTDAEKNNAETQRRQQALEQLKLEETNRENNKQQILTERYSKLSPEVRQDFPTAQTDAVRLIAEHLKGARRLDDTLTSEERFILQKAEDALKEAQKQNPEQQSINVSFSNQIDQQIYNNLVNRLTFEVLKAKGVVEDQEQANEIRGQMGLPEAEVQTPDLLSELPSEININSTEEPQSVKKEKREELSLDVSLNPKSHNEGSIVIDGNDVGYYWLHDLNSNEVYIHNIQIGFDEDEAKAYRGKGVGKKVYEKLGDNALKEGKHLVSSHWKTTQTSISPQALRVWEKLLQEGKARITEVAEGKMYDRVKGQEEVREIPIYEYIGNQQ